MNKQERLQEFNRRNIIDAAKILFLENGVSHTSMNDIAKKADYSKSTIYVYFKSKNEIYYAIIYEYMSLLKKAVEKVSHQAKSFKDSFLLFCDEIKLAHDNYPLLLPCLLGEILMETAPEDNKDSILSKIYIEGESIHGILEEILFSSISKGELRKDIKPFETTMILWSNICSLIIFSSNKEQYIEKSTKQSKEEFLKYGFEQIYRSVAV